MTREADGQTVQAVVPAAGEGTRMRPLTRDRPKALVEVAGQPLLAHVLDTLRPVATDCVVVIGYRGDQIRDRFGETYRGVSLTYVQQPERRGLADALLRAAPHVDGEFVSLNGDNVLRADLEGLVDHHRTTGADVTALVERVPRERAGQGAVFELAGGDGGAGGAGTHDRQRISGVVEKPDSPPSRLVPRGCYALSPAVFHACRLVRPGSTGERELTDALDLLLAASRRLETVPLDGWCVNVNTPADRERVTEHLDGAGTR